MSSSRVYKNRDLYLNKLIAFQDTEPVKVETGIRRCGKSSLLKLMIQHLLDTGVPKEQIVEMNFESHDYKDMTSDGLYNRVKAMATPGKHMYLFFDELQRVSAWEEAVNAFRVDLDCDIYITGSNAYLLDGIYSTVVVRDILEREKRREQHQITDPVLLRKIILFLVDNIGCTVSANSIGNTLVNEGLLEGGTRKNAPSAHTVQAYVRALLESYIFYEVKRFDIKGKEFLRTLGKYYIADIGLRNYLLGFRDRDTGHVLENTVYFELLRRGYDVAIGKVDNAEIDFFATKAVEKIYVQVTESMTSEDVRRRELSPLQKVKDNYEKTVLSLDPGLETSYEGIKSLNLIDWLVS